MADLPERRPEAEALQEVPLTIRAYITGRGLRLSVDAGGRLRLPRDNVTYYETIGRWLCDQIGAPAIDLGEVDRG